MLGPLSLVARFWLVARLLPNPSPTLSAGHWALGFEVRLRCILDGVRGAGVLAAGMQACLALQWKKGPLPWSVRYSTINLPSGRRCSSRPCRPGPKPWLALPQHPSSSAKRPSRSCPRSQTLAVAFQPTRTHPNMAPVALHTKRDTNNPARALRNPIHPGMQCMLKRLMPGVSYHD